MKQIIFIIGLAIIAIGMLGFMFFVIFSLSFLGTKDCGAAYPVYGKEISIKLDTIKIEDKIKIPNGELFFTNLSDTLPPIMIKINEKSKVEWAYKFETKNDELSMNAISKLSLDLENNKIIFFNESHFEPGAFYFTDDYEFDYVCLSPF